MASGSSTAASRGMRSLAACVGIFGMFWILTGWIVSGSSRNLYKGSLAMLAIAITLRVLQNWREGIYLSFIWLLFEDLVRKYLGNDMTIYFGKDVLVGVSLLSFLMVLRRRTERPIRLSFLTPLCFFVLLGVAQVFNPNSPSFFYGLLGLRMYFFYIPLIFVGYALIETEADLRRLLQVSTVLAGLIALVGIIQVTLNANFLNPKTLAPEIEQLGHLVRFTPSGLSVMRPPSVFVSDGRFGAYLMMAFILACGTTGHLLLRKERGRAYALLTLALISVAAVLSGARSTVLYVAISALVMAAGMMWGAPWGPEHDWRLSRTIRRAALWVGLGLLLTVIIFPKQIASRWAFYTETLSPESPDFEGEYRAWDYPLKELLKAFSQPNWAIGNGIGTASLGAQYLEKILNTPSPRIGVESGYGVLVLELGVPGLVLWLAWTLSFLISAYRILLRVKNTYLFPVALSIFWFAFLLLFPISWTSLGTFQNYIIAAYFWLLVGVFWRLPHLAAPSSERTNEQTFRVNQVYYRRSLTVSR